MRAPLSWLREYVTVDATAAEIAQRLAISALEVERVIDVGVPDVDGNLGRFLVGRVLAADAHPNADRLRVCQVDVGEGEPARSSAAPGTSTPARPSRSRCPVRSSRSSTSRSTSASSAARSRAG